MTNSPLVGAAARPLACLCPEQIASNVIAAAQDLLGHLVAGRRIGAAAIRTAMHSAFGASDASGSWDWKAAYEAVEVAQLLFVRRYGLAIHAKTADPFERLKFVERIARLVPTQIRAIEQGLADGHASVVQIVSTGEALLSRRLADIDPGEWNDVQVDITPREYVLDYLLHSFPTQLHESFTDGDGNLASRPAYDDDGNVIQCREAIERRDRLIEKLASMEPVQGALDQIVQRFGTDMVAEVTGRSRRIVRRVDANGDRLAVENRPAHANLAEAQAFMEDRKQILVFSDAGGTGRSYHADLGSRNQRLRHHYLLEAGWKADTAIQGLGRTNRTNQAQPPLFRPVATNVQAEKRFLSTIARRLDTLGAI